MCHAKDWTLHILRPLSAALSLAGAQGSWLAAGKEARRLPAGP